MVANHFVTMLQSTRVGDAGGAEVRRWAIQLTAALRHGLSVDSKTERSTPKLTSDIPLGRRSVTST